MKNPRKLIIGLIAIALATSCNPSAQKNSSQQTLPKPKNIIILIGDGMGFNHVKSANYYNHGTDNAQIFEQSDWTHFALTTYPSIISTRSGDTLFSTGYNPREAFANSRYVMADYTDSGAGGTSLSTGRKSYNGTIALGIHGDTLVHMSQAAKALGKAIGVVSSVQLSHATPASFAAHNQHRNNYAQIARYMFFNTSLDVIMAAGNPDFDNDGNPAQTDGRYAGGNEIWNALKLNDGRAVFETQEGTFRVRDANGDGTPDPWHLIQTRDEFKQLASGNTPRRILGVPMVNTTLRQARTSISEHTLPFQTQINESIPTLEEMTRAALNVLNQNSKGFFVMIEGGAIDWASHSNQTDRLIEEQTDFNNAINAVVEWVEKNSNWNETLVIITADHETGYISGPGEPSPRYPNLVNNGKGNLPGLQWNSEDHTNKLVPFYAKGPGAEQFRFFARENDPVYGPFIQNTDIAALVFLMWGKPQLYQR